MTAPYEIHLTRLARAVAETRFTVAAVKARARAEVDGLDLSDVASLGLHCFRMADDGDYDFVCLPDPRGGLRVDTVSFEEMDPLTAGPFAGMKLKMPRADSEDDEETET